MTVSNDVIDEVLRQEQDRLAARRQDLESQMGALQGELDGLVRRLGHITALLQDGTGPEPTHEHGAELETTEHLLATDNDPVEIARTVLEERGGEPLHYKELADMVLQRGGSVPGRNPAQTLVSRLVKDDRFVRPLRRGYYALRVNYPKVRSVGARRKPARKKAQGRNSPGEVRARRS